MIGAMSSGSSNNFEAPVRSRLRQDLIQVFWCQSRKSEPLWALPRLRRFRFNSLPGKEAAASHDVKCRVALIHKAVKVIHRLSPCYSRQEFPYRGGKGGGTTFVRTNILPLGCDTGRGVTLLAQIGPTW